MPGRPRLVGSYAEKFSHRDTGIAVGTVVRCMLEMALLHVFFHYIYTNCHITIADLSYQDKPTNAIR